MEPNEIYDLVQARYGELAGRSYSGEHTAAERTVAESFGYEASELSSIPEAANLGVSCGNPLALANLREVSLNRTMRHLLILYWLSWIELVPTTFAGRDSCRLGQWRRH